MDSIFGADELSFGPAHVRWDTESGGQDLDVGGTDKWTLKKNVGKIELKESQAGSQAADKAVNSQSYSIEGGLSRMTVERLGELVQGIEVEKDSQDRPTRIWLASAIGELDSSKWKQLTMFQEIAGAIADPATQPFAVLDIWRAAPASEGAELVFDDASQRFYGVMFMSYIHRTKLTPSGRPSYGATRTKVYIS